MNNNEIREPIQKRSIEKKEKIIKSGFELICQKGYYNTNTAEIAKKAGVSTGIVYQYFKDKHDIFICGLEKYANSIFYPIPDISNLKNNSIEELVRNIIKVYIKDHKLSTSAHEEIMSMVHSDKDVSFYFYKREMDITTYLSNLLKNNGYNSDNLFEKVHIMIGMIDNLCHEVVYHRHNKINYDIMTELVIKNILNLIN